MTSLANSPLGDNHGPDSTDIQASAGETANEREKLKLSFSGRIIDHLGIQMYQSPVAALAEIVSNAWDANAEHVNITLPVDIKADNACFIISDDGCGMTFSQCQERFLTVGRNRRSGNVETTPGKGRPVLGRKGIGKFAGFGIAKLVHVSTISQETGEKTVFQLDLDQLRSDSYVQYGTVDVLEYLEPNESRRQDHSTVIALKKLTLNKTPNEDQFSRSMARRFGLRGQLQDFSLTINNSALKKPEDSNDIDMLFPRDYTDAQFLKHNLEKDPQDEEWALEDLADGQQIRWRIAFYKKPITDDDLRGISVFANIKLAQRPFQFNVTGVSGLHGLEYMAGRVYADYIDAFSDDLIATERQRINWDAAETGTLLAWGQGRIRELLNLWRAKRTVAKLQAVSTKLAPFAKRLDRMQFHERRIIDKALRSLASIGSLDEDDFLSLSQSLILAWEGGRLKDLIDQIGQTETMNAEDLLKILVEAKVLTSLQTAEAVKARIELIAGLNERIKHHDLENAVRDYIAANPWLIDHQWETFQVEKSIDSVCKIAAQEAKLDSDKDWNKRIDLILSSGHQLLVLEFMQPGLTVDRDHLNRFEFYVQSIRTQLEAATASPFKYVSGLLVSDNLHKSPVTKKKIEALASQGMQALDWQILLTRASARWKDFLSVLVRRAPEV